MERELLDFLSRARSCGVTVGEQTYTLRLLSARETLALRRETAQYGGFEAEERALWANAALLAAALFREGKRVFESADEVLSALGIGELNVLVERYAVLDGTANPSCEDGRGRIEALKKA